jgi:hypothetical protein
MLVAIPGIASEPGDGRATEWRAPSKESLLGARHSVPLVVVHAQTPIR